ncbi:hypothetical protein NM686_012750 [Methylomonas rapida]|uniref:Uncharacterized protein n=1 Tax=Methylomonas rapida TaxID=2963939 RepID=A0ABY7GK12_9GAMM|nr:hypothetical protein [Methylomonas rapida]WAR43258.1 hypothetical protein NM686_012750 [Methylomonas rapida]
MNTQVKAQVPGMTRQASHKTQGGGTELLGQLPCPIDIQHSMEFEFCLSMAGLWIMGDDTAVQIVCRAKPLAKLDAITMPRHIILNQPQENRSMQIVDSRSLNPLRIPWQHAFNRRLFLREPVNAVRRFPFDTAERANDWRSGAQLEQRFSQH